MCKVTRPVLTAPRKHWKHFSKQSTSDSLLGCTLYFKRFSLELFNYVVYMFVNVLTRLVNLLLITNSDRDGGMDKNLKYVVN